MSNYREIFRGVVYPWQSDHQGHMNVMHYLGLFDQSYWHLFSMMGFTRAYMEEQRKGFVSVKDTITYSAEQGPGATIIIESGLTKIGSSSAVSYAAMKNTESDETAATWENVGVSFILKPVLSVIWNIDKCLPYRSCVDKHDVGLSMGCVWLIR